MKILIILAIVVSMMVGCGIGMFVMYQQQTPCQKTFCEMTESERIQICPNRIKTSMENGGFLVIYACGSKMFLETHDLNNTSMQEFTARLEYYASYGNNIELVCEHAEGTTFQIQKGL